MKLRYLGVSRRFSEKVDVGGDRERQVRIATGDIEKASNVVFRALLAKVITRVLVTAPI